MLLLHTMQHSGTPFTIIEMLDILTFFNSYIVLYFRLFL